MNARSATANEGPADAYLALDRVWKAYGPAAEPVVRDISFEVGQGQFVTLLGPSGSGKTTTLMMAAGFEAPTQGRIFARGRDVSGLPANRRDFGVVFQGYALFPHMSVRENVEFPLRMRRMGGQDRRRQAMDMLDKVGLTAFADRRPRELSGGQQQRVALARALAFGPDVLLLDEPLGALDKKMRESLQVEIKDIQRNTGVSVLFITHDQEEAMMMSDVICVMENGRIAQTGSPEEVYNHPADAFVATFLGETNLMPCEICGVDQELANVRMADGMSCLARLGDARLGDARRTALSLRPERLRLLAPDETADNVADAELIERVFLGQQVRYTVRALGQMIVVIGGPGGAPPVGAGERLRIGWARDAGQILAAD